jgi:hypothetical protein
MDAADLAETLVPVFETNSELHDTGYDIIYDIVWYDTIWCI